MLAKEVRARVSIQILLRIDIFLTTASINRAAKETSVIDDAFKLMAHRHKKSVDHAYLVFPHMRIYLFADIPGTTVILTAMAKPLDYLVKNTITISPNMDRNDYTIRNPQTQFGRKHDRYYCLTYVART